MTEDSRGALKTLGALGTIVGAFLFTLLGTCIEAPRVGSFGGQCYRNRTCDEGYQCVGGESVGRSKFDHLCTTGQKEERTKE